MFCAHKEIFIKLYYNLKWKNSPLNATISSVSVLQITAEHTESFVEGERVGKYVWLI